MVIKYTFIIMGLFMLGTIVTGAPMVAGKKIPNFAKVFRLNSSEKKLSFSSKCIASSAPENILWPGEQLSITIQLINNTDSLIACTGRIDVIGFATRGIPEDIWTPDMYRTGYEKFYDIKCNITPHSFQNITLSPIIPEHFGSYGIVIDLGKLGREFLLSCSRTLKPDITKEQFPAFCLDGPPRLSIKTLYRLGSQAVRLERSFMPVTDPNFKEWFQHEKESLLKMHKDGITVLYMIGAGSSNDMMPLKRPRPFLDDTDMMLDGKADHSWHPNYDDDFEKFCYLFASELGWPKGPITAISLFNEPWEGRSISGWGADMIRYRELYKKMANSIIRARNDVGCAVLVGGCDSTANALDKLFCDGSNEFLPLFDFSSIHYQGLFSGASISFWAERKHSNGRVKIWDTESWVANTEDRVATTLAAFRSAGYDRAMGIFAGNIASPPISSKVYLPDGSVEKRLLPVNSWSVAPAVAAANKLIGNRTFQELLFQDGLPWCFVFNGNNNDIEDGTVVLSGDIRILFGHDNVPFRSVMTTEQAKQIEKLQQNLLSATNSEKRLEITSSITSLKQETFAGSSAIISLQNRNNSFLVYDHNGNIISPVDGKYTLPLDGTSFYLRSNGKSGGFKSLLTALKQSDISGISAVYITATDMNARVKNKPKLEITLQNILNHPVTGLLSVSLGDLKLILENSPLSYTNNNEQAESHKISNTIKLAPYEKKRLTFSIISGNNNPNNIYPLKVIYKYNNGDSKDVSVLYEDMHVNIISKKSITVDGNLEEWQDIPAYPMNAEGKIFASMAEKAWRPFEDFSDHSGEGFASVRFAYDNNNFYLAVSVADTTTDNGTINFRLRDDDKYFYPKTSYTTDNNGTNVSLSWPDNCRRFSYRKYPDLPFGTNPLFDNIQIGFNILPPDKKTWHNKLPGIMDNLIDQMDTDYEFALNNIAKEHGGGTEIVRLLSPNMPFKHFYPRQPKSKQETKPAKGKLVILHNAGIRIVEAAIPWSEIPEVYQSLKKSEPVKITLRVNDGNGVCCMELPSGRSVSKENCWSLHPAWKIHWSNEIKFYWEK